MTELSPTAQAVWDAYEAADCDPYETDPRRASLSDALRAAVTHTQQQDGYDVWECDADDLLTIAAELRGDTTTTQENN